MEEKEKIKWPINNSGNTEKKTQKLLKTGKYTCRLNEIKLVETKANAQYLKPGQKEGDLIPKVLFVFLPIDHQKDLKEDEECSILIFANPSMNEKSTLYELLEAMTETGEVPDEALEDEDNYQKYSESFKDKMFAVWCKPSDNKKYNNFVRLIPIDVPDAPTFEDDDIPF